MNQPDYMKEFLNRKLSELNPQLPVNDWQVFHGKLVLKMRLHKYSLYTLNVILCTVLLAVGLWNNPLTNGLKEKLPAAFKYGKTGLTSSQTMAGGERLSQSATVQNGALTGQIPKDDPQNAAFHPKSHKGVNSGFSEPAFHHRENSSADPENPVNDPVIIANSAMTVEDNASPGLLEKCTFLRYDLADFTAGRQEFTGVKDPGGGRFKLPHNPFLFELMISPGYSFYGNTYGNNSGGAVHKDYPATMDNTIKYAFSFAAGLNFSWYPASVFSVKTGLISQTDRIIYRYRFSNNQIPVFDSSLQKIVGYLSGPDRNVNRAAEITNFYMIIPLEACWRVLKIQRFSFGVTGGGNFNYLLGSQGQGLNQTRLTLENISSSLYKRMNWQVQTGFNIDYNINGFLSAGIEPRYRKFMYSVYKENQLVSDRPWFFDLNLSLKMKF